jgi:hypothetical protein
MTNLFQVVSIVGGVALAGLLVCLMNIRKAIMVGMGAAWLALNIFFFLSLSELNSASLFSDFLNKSGTTFMSLLLVGFYLFCVVKNKDYIQDSLMPDLWYTFSYFIVICTGVNIVSIVKFYENQDSFWNSMALLGNTLLFAFVVIEWIICSFYRTDGFMV